MKSETKSCKQNESRIYSKILASGQFRSYEMAFTHRHFLEKVTDKSVYLAAPLIIITDTITTIIITNTKVFILQQNIIHD